MSLPPTSGGRRHHGIAHLPARARVRALSRADLNNQIRKTKTESQEGSGSFQGGAKRAALLLTHEEETMTAPTKTQKILNEAEAALAAKADETKAELVEAK